MTLRWMRCHNFACGQIIVKVRRRFWRANYKIELPPKEGDPEDTDETWFAVPRNINSRPPLDPFVEQKQRDMARHYRDAAAILDISPSASSVLSRRVLSDLLEVYADRPEWSLADKIDKFNEDTTRPYELRKNLHYLREIADFAAHTKRDKDDQAIILDTSKDEAEWTLQVVEDLFDYFIVTPAKNEEMRTAIDDKIDRADRRAIKPLPEDRERE